MVATYSFTIAGPPPTGWPVLKAVLSAIGDELGVLMGTLSTRLRADHAVGASILLVESAYGFPSSGTLVVEGETDLVTYSGVDLTPGAQRFTGCSVLTADHKAEAEVIDYSRLYSRIDAVRRATQVAYADGSDLSRVGRRHAVDRPRALSSSDTIFRSLVQLIAYMPRNNIYALEQVLDVLFPGGGWDVYTSLIEHPAKIFITLPDALGTSARGRAFMGAREDLTSGSTTAITCSESPVKVTAVRIQPTQVDIPDPLISDDWTLLPSVESPPWTFVGETAGVEATYFSIVSGVLQQTVSGTDSGREQLTRTDIGQEMNRLEACWHPDTLTVVGARPWYLCLRDGAYEYALAWSDTDIILGQSDGTVVAGPFAVDLSTGWQQLRLERIGDMVYGSVGRTRVLSADVADFAVSSDTLATFGYFDNSDAQNWIVQWDNVQLYLRNRRNYWNLAGTAGQFTLSSDVLSDVAGVFVAGDVTKRVRTVATNDVNDGIWEIIARPSASQIQLDGIERTDGVLDVLTPTVFETKNPRFREVDVGKDIVIASGLNIGTHAITAFVDRYNVICAGSAFVTEDDVTWKFSALNFATESNVEWEIVDAGSVTGAALTLRAALPYAATPVTVEYTTVESAQALQDESAENDPVDTYWPFYVYGPERWIEDLLNEIKMGGIILDFNRVY